MAPPHPTLFSPLKLGNIQLKHRVIMAPLTRRRAPEHIPGDSVAEHYAQRATDGGLLIAEATHISVMGGNYYGCPGIFTPEQVRAWKKVTDAVHKKGGFIYLQLWHVGRTTHPVNIGGRKPLGASPIAVSGKVLFTPNGPQDSVVPQEMTLEDIKNTVDDYAHAARYAIAAGFDGVEIHGANGYLLDQFLCDNINVRTDAYGGSTEKRARLMLEVTDRIVKEIGRERVGIRLSPFGFFQDTATSDILAQYGYAAAELEKRGLAYIHIIEPRMGLVISAEEKMQRLKTVARSRGIEDQGKLSIEPFRKIIKTTPLITNGEFTGKDTNEVFEKNLADAIAYGRYFISNPDLPERIKNGWPLTPYNRKTFYTFGTEGYTDYPTYSGAKSQL